MSARIFKGGRIFDGTSFLHDQAIAVEDGKVTAIGATGDLTAACERIDLHGDIIALGYVDLQVNGGGGIMLNDDPSVATLRRIAEAHRRAGVMALLPTLISDAPEVTRAAISSVGEAVRDGVPGIAGLHLEGPHLSTERKGAHDAGFIRPMGVDDLEMLTEAAKALPVLMVTVAPESVTEAQVRELAAAGVLVSLGHTNADFGTCQRYFAAGAVAATHLFNAMSQLGSRDPGLVGAALANGGVSAGLIADGIHVHAETVRAAFAAKRGPGRMFLVSDAMAVAGTDLRGFTLGGRSIGRRDGRLTLPDGTLAGADLDLTSAVRFLVGRVDVPLEAALQAVTTLPAGMIGMNVAQPNHVSADATRLIRIASDLSRATPLL